MSDVSYAERSQVNKDTSQIIPFINILENPNSSLETETR